MCTRTGRPPGRLREQTGPGRRKIHHPDMYVLEESDCAVVCAEQRIVQEG